MAIIKCSECGKDVSDKASVCPHCGAPLFAIDETDIVEREKIFKPGFLQPFQNIKIDKKHGTFKVGLTGEVLFFEDIMEIEIFENGSSIGKTSAASIIGRTAVGALFNPVGALIGGVTAKKKSVEVVDRLEVQLTVRSEKKPLVKIEIPIKKKTKKDSKDYNKAIDTAKELVATLKNLQ